MKKIALLGLALLLFNCNSKAQKIDSETKTFPISKTDMEWKEELSDIEYHVLREEGTEPRYSSPFKDNKISGTYVCKACGTPLFKSENKYDSGSGWPSFDREIKGQFDKIFDKSLGSFLSKKENKDLSIDEINLLCDYNKFLKERI